MTFHNIQFTICALVTFCNTFCFVYLFYINATSETYQNALRKILQRITLNCFREFAYIRRRKIHALKDIFSKMVLLLSPKLSLTTMGVLTSCVHKHAKLVSHLQIDRATFLARLSANQQIKSTIPKSTKRGVNE